MKNREVNNKHKNKYGKLKDTLSIWSFKRKRSPDGLLIKHKPRSCAHGGMQKWEVIFLENYSPVVNWIRVRSLLAMTSLHEFTSKSIDFVLSFTQADLDMYFFMDLPLGMGVGGNRGEWFLKLKINFMDSIKKLKIGLIF